MTVTHQRPKSKHTVHASAKRTAAVTNNTSKRNLKRHLKKSTNITDFLKQLCPEGIFEIRVLGQRDSGTSKKPISSGYFDSHEKAAKCIRVAELSKPAGIYCTINPVAPELLSRSPNEITCGAIKTTKKEDILRRCWLLIDIDPIREAEVPSTQSELDAAKHKVAAVRKYLRELQWASPIQTMSGNGTCLLYPIDLPNDDSSKELIRAVLHTLAGIFDDEHVKLDKVVFDAPRIVKVSGTVARKGIEIVGLDDAECRPHRRSTWYPPTWKGIVSREQLEAIASLSDTTTNNSKKTKKSALRDESGEVRIQPLLATENHVSTKAEGLSDILEVPESVVESCRRYIEKMPPAIEGQNGSGKTFSVACAVARFGLSLEQGITVLTEYSDRCLPPWTDAELKHKLDDAYRTVRQEGKFGSYLTTETANEQVICERTSLKSESANDVAVAFVESLMDESGCLTTRRWRQTVYAWIQGRYVEVKDDELRSLLVRYLQQRHTDVKAVLINDILSNVRPLIEIESHIEPPCVINECYTPLSTWQPKDIYVGPERIVHLPSMFGGEDLTSVPNTPSYFSMVANGCDLSKSVQPPDRWLQFLDEIFSRDPESIKLLQQWMGYLMTPDTRRQKIMLILGPARSGKGTIGRVIQAIAGPDNCCSPTLADLSSTFGLSVLLGKSVATIGDARLSARNQGGSLVERLLSISGEDSISVNRKYRDLLTTRLTTRFTIMTNELPRLDDASAVIASRFLTLKTKKSFLGKEDLDLTASLLEQKEAILSWAMRGWESLNDEGEFNQTSDTNEAQAEMRRIASPVLHFVEDQCQLVPDKWISKDSLYQEYLRWCDRNGFDKHAKTMPMFARDLVACCAGVTSARQRPGNGEPRQQRFHGIRLKTPIDANSHELKYALDR